MLKKLKQYSLAEILLLAGILVIISGTLVYAFKANSNANKIYNSVTSGEVIPGNAIKIDSNPTGVSVLAEKYCDSAKLNKQTPFTCAVPRSVDSLTITAPATFTDNGKTYTFQEWTGCAEDSSDKTDCKVGLPNKDGIKATYTLATATTKTITPPPPPVVAPQATCNGEVVNNGKTCRFVITYDSSRLPGRLTAYIQQPASVSFTAECSASDACTTYAQNPQPVTGPYTNSGIDFSINKPTDITLDVPMSQDYGSNSNYLFSKFVYTKATYANGGGGTFYDGLEADYTFAYKN